MFRRSVAVAFAAVICSAVSGTPTAALAADLKLLGPVSLRVVLPSVLPQFEQSTGHKVPVGYATIGTFTKRVLDGEAADVVMVSPGQNDELRQRGKLLESSRVEIAKVGFAVFVKKGAPRPELGSVEALKRTLLAARSIALGDPAAGGGAGVYTAGLMQRLGLAEEIKARTRLVQSGTEVAEAVAKGEAEVGIGVASDAAIIPGLDAIALPAGAQSYSVYVAGIVTDSKDREAAAALLAFLSTPAAKDALRIHGFETP